MAKRNLYLKTTPVEEAGKKYMRALEEAGCLKPQTEIIDTYESLNRITSEAIYAKCCSPLFNAAAMDGIAVKSAETAGASEENTVYSGILDSAISMKNGEKQEISIDFTANRDFSQAVATISADGGYLFFGDVFDDYLEYFNMVLAQMTDEELEKE